jgi:hypothetical protein
MIWIRVPTGVEVYRISVGRSYLRKQRFDIIPMTLPLRLTEYPKRMYRAELLASHIFALSIRVWSSGIDL